jgi:D-xylose transport system ATP-binding protein
MLDEPTAALGVAQTAEVLNLVETLRERGHAVILISHNMADVMAVGDRVVVLRLGRNNGDFDVASTSNEEIVAAITGATSNAVSARSERVRARRGADAESAPGDPGTPDAPDDRPVGNEEVQP